MSTAPLHKPDLRMLFRARYEDEARERERERERESERERENSLISCCFPASKPTTKKQLIYEKKYEEKKKN